MLAGGGQCYSYAVASGIVQSYRLDCERQYRIVAFVLCYPTSTHGEPSYPVAASATAIFHP
jgi:hypothetical protein